MFDDLRQASESSFEDETPAEEEDSYPTDEVRPRRRRGNFLGMTPFQRFFITVMLLMMACLFAPVVLLITEKIYPSFLF